MMIILEGLPIITGFIAALPSKASVVLIGVAVLRPIYTDCGVFWSSERPLACLILFQIKGFFQLHVYYKLNNKNAQYLHHSMPTTSHPRRTCYFQYHINSSGKHSGMLQLLYNFKI